jgi:hypothetical protein
MQNNTKDQTNLKLKLQVLIVKGSYLTEEDQNKQ